MNSDFAEAFVERCPHLEIVFDHFHIVKNFNDKVVSEIRKDEYRRLIAEGEIEAAKQLKGSKYILTSKRSTLVNDAAKLINICITHICQLLCRLLASVAASAVNQNNLSEIR